MTDQEPLRVYWQPGCTSCLNTKEFLANHAIEFEAINVRTEPRARAELEAIGARSIPVVARGTRFVYGQDLADVARFVGVPPPRVALAPAVLVDRLAALLRAAVRYTRQLPSERLETLIPGRDDRAWIDLAYHPAMIVAGFLTAARGGVLEFEFFERRPVGAQRTVEAVTTQLESAALDLTTWWSQVDSLARPAEVATYYGRRSLDGVLERTAWHVAQHCRQLESLVAQTGSVPEGPLGPAELGGLPLPAGLWDKEVQ
ncbi:MAG TPA: glutaredoxin family protein [Steroidobacteraceae bacterium]|nr:glutaredoxin family protein [Steroidobacteraceae bacterium]